MKAEIYNENCLDTIKQFKQKGIKINVIITSPPYNQHKQHIKDKTTNYSLYDSYDDDISDEEYCNRTVNLFNQIENILDKNGVILYNLSYSTQNPVGMYKVVYKIITETDFTIADNIVWWKRTSQPNNVSPNKLTRQCEFIYVICRKSEYDTYQCNKEIISHSKTGQAIYENLVNLIIARPNDGNNIKYNKATFSTEMVTKLLNMYATNKDNKIYDPFGGTGTTCVACERLGYKSYMSELSKKQCEYVKERMELEFCDTLFGEN